MKAIIKFYLLACLISWMVWSPLYLSHFGVQSFAILPYHHALGALGPAIACFVLQFVSEGRAGVRILLRSMTKINDLKWLLIAVVGPFVLLLIALIINFLINGYPISFSSIGKTSEFPQFNLLSYFLYNLVFFGFGEEAGWKGYMLPRLQQRFNALSSSVIFTIFWSVWHIPLFLYRPGYTSMDAAGITGWFFSLLTGSVLLTWLFNSSKGSIFVCAVFHATIDIAFVSDAVNTGVSNSLGFLITVWGIVTIVIFGAKNLSRSSKVVDLTKQKIPEGAEV
jgi:membrane protease YdiL (CAAX protease family)